jgi:hypothetical protein
MNSRQDQPSHLFLVRFWSEGAQDAQEAQKAQNRKEWNGKVQHVVSGEALAFRGYHGLAEAIERMMAERESARHHTTDE